MKSLNEKLNLLKKKLDGGEKITIAIFGLGSVGCYLLDYLVSLADPQLKLIVVGRNAEKMQQDVNIIRTAATIRRQMRSEIVVEGGCDFKDIASIEAALRKIQPDFIVNSSRLYAGLKYEPFPGQTFVHTAFGAPCLYSLVRTSWRLMVMQTAMP